MTALRRQWRRLRRPPSRCAAALILLALVAVTVVQLIAKDGAADSTTVALLMLAGIVAFVLLAPRQAATAVRRMTGFKVAGIEVGLRTVASAERVKPVGGEGDGFEVQREDRGFGEIVKEIRMKLRFAWNITDLRAEVASNRDYHDIAWRLRAGRLLKDEEARLVLDLLAERDAAVAGLPPEAQDEYLDAAWEFASRFGSTIWDRYVRREMRAHGWLVLDFEQVPGHRPDFLAYRNGHWVLVAPRVGGRNRLKHYPATRKRLVGYSFSLKISGRCIVIPPKRKATVLSKAGWGQDDEVKVLEFQGSLREFPIRAFDSSPENQDFAAVWTG